MTVDESYNNYLSHEWKTAIGDTHTGERLTYCEICGVENLGDPREFDWLNYLPCDREED